MSGRNVNVYLPEETYEKIKNLVQQRKISRFVDEAIKDRLEKEKQQTKEELRKKMIAGYQKDAKNEELQKEMEIWDRVSGDGLEDE